MIPVIGIPHYNRADLLVRCLRSIDYPVGTIAIINNGFGMIPEFITWVDAKIEIIRHPNSGVASSWNEVIKLFPADYWLLSNDDIEFAPGDLERMDCETRKNLSIPLALYGNHGASWWTINSLAIERVGLFDENIYPAYLEDCDWSYRADLIGVKRATVEGMKSRHGDSVTRGSCTVNVNAEIQKENIRTHSGNFNYYRQKWGGVNEHEIFKHPFNDPTFPLWAWKFDPKRRNKQQWNLSTGKC